MSAPPSPAPATLPPPAPPPRRLPPLPGVSGARIAGAVLLAIGYFALIGYGPYVVEQYLAAHGIGPVVPPEFLLLAGAVIAIVAGASVATKPTRAWGPVRMLSGTVAIVYLLYLLRSPAYHVTVHAVSLSVSYPFVLELFLIPPVFTLAAGAVTTAGDARYPEERIRLQFPS